MIIFHHNDLDGRCAGAIAYRAITSEAERKEVEITELDYKDEILPERIKKDEKIVIVDFSFTPAIMAKVLEKTKDVTWIDHHKTAEAYDYGMQLKGLREFEEKKFSGCELAWQYYFPNTEMPEAVRLIGDRDCWRWMYRTRSAPFYHGMALVEQDPKHETWDALFDKRTGFVETVLSMGKTVADYRELYYANYRKSYGYPVDWEGHRCYALNLYRCGSEGFGDMLKMYDIGISYVHSEGK